MFSTRAYRQLASQALSRPAAPTIARQCAFSRCYATKSSPSKTAAKPTPKATAAKLNSVRKKAASRKVDIEENDNLAARTPLKKPSSDGLGVPSASASPASSKASSSNSEALPEEITPPGSSDVDPAAAEKAASGRSAHAEAEKREALLRSARLNRADRVSEVAERDREEKEYGEKQKRLKSLYMRVVVGLPFVIVLSWKLWERCEFRQDVSLR